MGCKPICKLCPNLVISNSVTFNGTELVINLPAGSYANGKKVCIVVAQTIPANTTINAPVIISIGAGAQPYPLTTSCCTPVTACGIRTRTRYSTIVATTATSATFKLLGKPCAMPNNQLIAVNGTAPA